MEKSTSFLNSEIIDLGQRNTENAVIIFLHIPKGGGTTLKSSSTSVFKKHQ